MDVSVRRALTEEERGQAIAMAFANAQQELPPEACCKLIELAWAEIVHGVIVQGCLFDWTPRFARQSILFAEHATARLGYEVQRRYGFYGGFDDQTPPTLQAHLFRLHVPPETAVPLMRRFEVELRRVVGADMSEASTIAPPIS